MPHEIISYYGSITIILVVATALGFLATRFKQSLVTGYILAGVLLGPHVFKIIQDPVHIRKIAEIGLLLLLFTLGLEFSFTKLKSIRRIVFGAGTTQVVGTIAAGTLIALAFGFPLPTAIFIGCVISLSSTAVVSKELSTARELDSPQGRISIGILIFQDLAIIPMMIFLPVLQNVGAAVIGALAWAGLKAVVFLIAAYLVGRFVFPVILRKTTEIGGKELLILASFMLVFLSATVSQWFGLSMALGAFVAGALLAETEFNLQLHHLVTPFREIFMSLFFVSIGLLFNLPFLFTHLWEILLFVFVIGAINTLVCSIVVLAFGYPIRIAVFASLILAEIGEFSFILIQMGASNNLINEEVYQLLISLVAVTLLMTPFVYQLATRISLKVEAVSFLRGKQIFSDQDKEKPVELKNHVIICGFGPVGQNLAFHLNKHGVPYVITEMNIKTVNEYSKKGFPIYFGDSASSHVLEKMGVQNAYAIAVTMLDPDGIDAMLQEAKKLNPKIVVLARVRFVSEIGGLLAKGVTEVISEELEVSQIITERLIAHMIK